MPYISNGKSFRWVDPSENYVLKDGETDAGLEPPVLAPDVAFLKDVALGEFRALRTVVFGRIDGMQGTANRLALAALTSTPPDMSAFQAQMALSGEIDGIKAALKAVPQVTTLTGDLAAMRRQLFVAWRTIAMAASDSIATAFTGFDA